MSDHIKSEYVKEYIQKTYIQLSDKEIATIVFNSDYNLPEMHRRLREIAEHTDDEELTTEIEERIAYDMKCVDLFTENSDRSCVYETYLKESDKDHDKDEALGHYIDYQTAFADMMKRGVGFIIKKYQIIGMPERFTEPQRGFNPRLSEETPEGMPLSAGDPIGSMGFDKSGNIESCHTCEIPRAETDKVYDWSEKRFERLFVELPNPFEAGDLVCKVGEPDRIGIVETSKTSWHRFLNQVKANNAVVDFSDASIVVEFMKPDGDFAHGHIQPVFLEKASLDKDDRRRMLLESASRLIAGRGALDEFFWMQEDYRKKLQKCSKE